MCREDKGALLAVESIRDTSVLLHKEYLLRQRALAVGTRNLLCMECNCPQIQPRQKDCMYPSGKQLARWSPVDSTNLLYMLGIVKGR